MKVHRSWAALGLAVGVLAVPRAFAQDGVGPGAAPPPGTAIDAPQAARNLPLEGILASVNGNHLVVQSHDGSTQTLQTDAQTRYLKDGRELLGLESIAEGSHVRASFAAGEGDQLRVASIEVIPGGASGTTGGAETDPGSGGTTPLQP